MEIKNQRILIIIIVILSLLVAGLGGYIIYDKVLSDSEVKKENKKDNIESKIIKDTKGNSYTLKLKKEEPKFTYTLVNEKNIDIFSYVVENYSTYEIEDLGMINIDTFNVKIHNIESKSMGYEYLAVEYDSISNWSVHNYKIITVNNGSAKEIIDIGSHGTGYRKEKKLENGDIDTGELENYIIEENTISFYYGNGCIEELDEKRLAEPGKSFFIKLILSENTYTVENIAIDYKVILAGEKC